MGQACSSLSQAQEDGEMGVGKRDLGGKKQKNSMELQS